MKPHLLHLFGAGLLGALLGLGLPGAAPLQAQPQAPERLAVLDAGTFIVVEANGVSLGEVLDRIRERLGVTITNAEILDLGRRIEGRRAGPPLEVMQWLVPDANVLLLSEARGPYETRPARLERITFFRRGTPGSPPAPGVAGAGAPPAAGGPGGAGSGAVAGRGPAGPADLRTDGTKPDAPGAPGTSVGTGTDAASVAEQLRALTPEAQLADQRAAYRVGGEDPPPNFLRPQNDATQTTMEQQQSRSQALAVEQLRALMGAMRSACTGTVC